MDNITKEFMRKMSQEDKSRKRNKIVGMDPDLWMLIWGANRYFCGRSTIASATFPDLIMKRFYKLLDENQKRLLAFDILGCLEDMSDLDKPRWSKFYSALKTESHYKVKGIENGEVITVFDANGKMYPLDKYIESPHWEMSVNPVLVEVVK